ncbi:MAG TPA: helix-turn-helix domain-containing protein, partial [Chromatiaceae bacterium]|nr:helix-turn-helix domain-containing protein [Chromatiaceae bacterium]
MTEERVTMSQRELDRVGVIRQVVEKGLRQRDAARQLGLSVRQIKRLMRRYRAERAAGLVSRHRGKRP